jgi:hypothetical protein
MTARTPARLIFCGILVATVLLSPGREARAAGIKWVDAAVIEQGKKALVAVGTTKGVAINGFFASDAGHVVTVAGPLEGTSAVTLKTSSGEEMPAKLVMFNTEADIAVLATGRKPPGHLKFSATPPKVGAPCAIVYFEGKGAVIAAADGQFLARRQGVDITSTRFQPIWSIAFSPTQNGGTGAPVICADGTAAGLMSATHVFGGKTPQVIFKAVPESDVSAILAASIKSGRVINFPKLGSVNPDILGMSDPHEQQGRTFVAKGDLLSAIEEFQKALGKFPESPTILTDLAYCLTQQGDIAKAKATLQKALQHVPNNVQVRLMLATLPGEDNVGRLKELTEDAPLFAIAWGQLGIFLFNAGRHDEALDALRKYTELEPDSIQAWDKYAEILLKQGKLQESRAARDRASSLESLYFKLRYSAPKRQ